MFLSLLLDGLTLLSSVCDLAVMHMAYNLPRLDLVVAGPVVASGSDLAYILSLLSSFRLLEHRAHSGTLRLVKKEGGGVLYSPH